MTNEQIATVTAAAESALGVRDTTTAADVQSILDRPNDGPANAHRRWVGAQVAQDWESGPAYDEENKKDPRLVDFSELPADERLASHLRYAIVRTLAAHTVFPEQSEPAESTEPIVQE